MQNTITIANVTMSTEAARLVEWTGIDPAEDVRRVRAGLSGDALLAECLEGCDDTEDMAAWRDYVVNVRAEADMQAWRERREAERATAILARYPDATDKRRESIRIAVELGADDETIERLAKAGRVGRLGYVTIAGRYLHLSRGRGWARLGRGADAVWGEKCDGGFRLREAGRWTVYSTDGFRREDREEWTVEMVHVGPQIWAVAS